MRSYCGFLERSPEPVRRSEVPWAGVVLIVNFGAPYTVAGEAFGSFTAGLADAPVTTEHKGAHYGVEINLEPLGARRLFGLPMSELANRVVDLDAVLPGAPLLVERLHDAPDWASRFSILDAVIHARLAAVAPAPAEMRWAWRRLRASDGRASIATLAAEVGWSRRHFGATFRDQLGLPPKTVARILRFERVVRLLEHDDGGCLAEIAYDCGFADQPHLNRDFRELAGTTPGAYLAAKVAFVQDETGAQT